MCGFTGFLGGVAGDNLVLRRMADKLIHRGPDDEGYWFDSKEKVGLAHRRLSILDLSSAGHQPMSSEDDRYMIIFNGEIYNHLAIRGEINNLKGFRGVKWRGHSDTETLLAGIEAWGLEETLKKSIGMFALALWDKHKKSLNLARDRFGEKPLYYGWQGEGVDQTFLFGSDLKALKAHPVFSGEIDRGSLSLLLRHSYVPAPYSIYKGISKLEAGSILSISLKDQGPVITKFWNAIDAALNQHSFPFAGSPSEAVDELELLAKSAVKQQMLSDVPLGAFLSGGIDSSTIVALMQSQSIQPVKTFTIGFNEKGFNEAVHAKAVAKHLGTDHTEMYVTPNQAMDVIPQIHSLFSEPFADSSQIPTFLVSQIAKQHVTVALSGDGGDELFCGYNRYELTARWWKKLSHIPSPIRAIFAQCIVGISPDNWDKLGAILPGSKKYQALGEKLHKGVNVLKSSSLQDLYLGIVSQISNPIDWVIDGYEPPTKIIGNASFLSELNDSEQMMLLDTVSYLQDDILSKVDRASMGVSLEGRVPFLDHRIYEFAWTLPFDYKLRNGQTKWPLRQILYKYVPKELIDRPKMGFGVPIGHWLRGPLRDWAESLLAEDKLRREGYFHARIIRTKWEEHLSGSKNWESQLWTILMFQAWIENEK
jgi:asparagine synthase (glutamine-hydrolysing)